MGPSSCRALSSLNQVLPRPTGFPIGPRWTPTKVPAGSLPGLYRVFTGPLPNPCQDPIGPCWVSTGSLLDRYLIFAESLPGLYRIPAGLLLGLQWVSTGLHRAPSKRRSKPYEPLLSPFSIRPAETFYRKPLSKRPLRFEVSRRQDSMASIRRIAYDMEKPPGVADRTPPDGRLSHSEEGRGVAAEAPAAPNNR